MSSVIDYFTSGIKDTYNQTVDYWSKDGSLANAADTIAWSVQHPKIVANATEKGFTNSINELGTAVKQDTYKLVGLVVLVGTAFVYFKKGGKK